MKLKDFKKGCNNILSETFENKYRVYGSEVTDGYERPSFFTELLPRTWRHVNKNIVEVGLTYKATFLEATHNEALCLSIIDAIHDTFGWTITAAGKVWLCDQIDFDYIGTTDDILQVSIDFATARFVSSTEPTADMIESVFLDLEIYSPAHELMSKETTQITKKEN